MQKDIKKNKTLSKAEGLAHFVKDEAFLMAYLNEIMDGDFTPEEMCAVCIDIIEAKFISQGINKTRIAKNMGITRDALYKALAHHNPTLKTFFGLLRQVGYTFKITPDKKRKTA